MLAVGERGDSDGPVGTQGEEALLGEVVRIEPSVHECVRARDADRS